MTNLLTFSPLAPSPVLPNPRFNLNPRPNHVSFPLKQSQTLSLTLALALSHRRPPQPQAATATAFTTAVNSLTSLPSLSLEFFRPPIDAVLAAFVRWLGLFREVLLVRVLLTWFPNLPWEKQPFSALRNLTDPCLAIFRDILPPVMGKRLDLSPILAFYVLEIVISILKIKPVI